MSVIPSTTAETSFTEYRNSSSGSLYVGFTLALV